jgi:virginiamycin B lyase
MKFKTLVNIFILIMVPTFLFASNTVSISIKEYSLPTPNSFPHDPHTPVFDRKEMLWFTVQQGNVVGRLNPITGDIQLKPLPTPDSRPYGIAINSKGIPFFCELGTNNLASIDPDTMNIKEYLLPRNARPRRLSIAAGDIVYFTDYASGKLGRFNPADGKVVEWDSPGGPDSRPYGMAITPDGAVWYSESGVIPNTIVRFDPKTKSSLSWKIPSGGGVVKNMVATPEGNLYLACSGKNKVAIVHVTK